jgi:hypothetical protein
VKWYREKSSQPCEVFIGLQTREKTKSPVVVPEVGSLGCPPTLAAGLVMLPYTRYYIPDEQGSWEYLAEQV